MLVQMSRVQSSVLIKQAHGLVRGQADLRAGPCCPRSPLSLGMRVAGQAARDGMGRGGRLWGVCVCVCVCVCV